MKGMADGERAPSPATVPTPAAAAGEKTVTGHREKLHDKVREWLSKQGYPLELEVGRQLRSAGFHDVYHGRFFRDPVTGKWRENDLLAVRHIFQERREGPVEAPLITVQFVIECKRSTKPWVVLASVARGVELQFPSGFLSGRIARALVAQAEMPNLGAGTQHGTGISLEAFGFDEVRGHGVVQAELGKGTRPNRRNAAYNAVRSAVAAATALANRADRHELAQLKSRKLAGAALRLPIVVCAAPLFLLRLDENGREQLTEVDEAVVGAPPTTDADQSLMLVRIVKPGVPLLRLCERAFADAAKIRSVLRSGWNEHMQRIVSRLAPGSSGISVSG